MEEQNNARAIDIRTKVEIAHEDEVAIIWSNMIHGIRRQVTCNKFMKDVLKYY